MFVCDKNFSCCDYQYAEKIKDLDADAQTCQHLIEVSPVIHAHWATKRKQFHDGETYCSHCNAELPYVVTRMSTVDHPYPEIEYIDKPNYCPNCGARMDGEENDKR